MALPAAMLSSCGASEEDDLFPESAAQRLNHSVNYWKELLTSSPNGWAMEYLPDDGAYGGFVYTAKFTGEDAEITASTISFASATGESWPAGTVVKSKYIVKAEQGVILSFDTYNNIFHFWSEPISTTYPDGYGGDYEFVFNSVSADEDTIQFTGKKHGNKMLMYRLEDQDAQGLARDLTKMRNIMMSLNFTDFEVDGRNYPVSFSNNQLLITDTIDDSNSVSSPLFFTKSGFKLYEPEEINGQKFQNFEFDDSRGAFVAKENNTVGLKIPSTKDQIEKTLGTGFAYRNGSQDHYVWRFVPEQMDDESRNLYDILINTDEMPRAITNFYGAYIGPANRYDVIRRYNSQVFAVEWHSPTYYAVNASSYHITYNFNNEDQTLSINYLGTGYNTAQNTYGGFREKYVTPFANRFFENSPYKVTLNEGIIKNEMRLVSISNPSIFFGLSLSAITDN